MWLSGAKSCVESTGTARLEFSSSPRCGGDLLAVMERRWNKERGAFLGRFFGLALPGAGQNDARARTGHVGRSSACLLSNGTCSRFRSLIRGRCAAFCTVKHPSRAETGRRALHTVGLDAAGSDARVMRNCHDPAGSPSPRRRLPGRRGRGFLALSRAGVVHALPRAPSHSCPVSHAPARAASVTPPPRRRSPPGSICTARRTS